MYIITNNQTYERIRMLNTSSSVRFAGESLPELEKLTGMIMVFSESGFELRTFDPTDYLRQEITGGSWLLTNIAAPIPQPVVATPVVYDLLESTANMTKLLMKGEKPKTADEIIMCSALYDEWQEGKHVAGDVFCVGGEPWECFQNYDNAVHPDIKPGNSAWYTFNRPFHGTSRETAREFVQPTGAHDMYLTGEWMISDGRYYRCKSDTAYNPADYADAWEDLGVDGTATEVPKEEETPVEDTIPEFVQPTGAHDAYNKGDKVTFEGKHYISLIDGNVYSPAAYPAGWQEQA